MIENIENNYSKTFDYKFKVYCYILKPIGLWPTRKKSFLSNIENPLKMVLSSLLVMCLIVPNTMQMVSKDVDSLTKFKIFGALSFIWMSMSQYVILIWNSKRIYRCIDDIRIFWDNITVEKEKKAMERFHRNGLRQSVRSAFIMYFGGFVYFTIMPFYSTSNASLNNNGTISNNRDLFFSAYSTFLNLESNITFSILYPILWLGMYINYTISIGSCALAALLLTNASAQLSVVMQRIENLILNFRECQKSKIQFANIIQQHRHILRYR